MDRRKFIKCGAILSGTCLGLCGAGKYFGSLHKTVKKAFNKEEFLDVDLPCKYPFEYFEIQSDGNVYSCCSRYMNYFSLGSIFEESLDDIWNGKKFKTFRNELIKGDFSRCDRNVCDYMPSDYDKTFDASKQMPKRVLLCYDWECNYRCITCRDEVRTHSDEELKKLDQEFIPKIVPFIKKVDQVTFSGGDPLASRHMRKLIRTLLKENPDMNIDLGTQGYFLDKPNMEELGITRICDAQISVHAATRETYAKVLRTDAFDRIMKNLAFISEWKKQGKVKQVEINFVVHSMNYKEMPAFVKIAEKFDVMANFTTYKPWPTAEMHKRYNEVAVFLPGHKDYKKLQHILQNPLFKSEHCILSRDLLSVALDRY